eukprot:c24017_g1_i1 orf=428-1726(-)
MERLSQPLLLGRSGNDDQRLRNVTEPEPKERLSSLDVFRGFTIAAMIVVDCGGGLWSPLDHSPWNGVTFADFVVPGFLFIVGISLALTLKKVPEKKRVVQMLSLRILKLLILGLILQGGYFHGTKDLSYGVDLRNMRIMGVLQRIAVAYSIVAACEVYTKKIPVSDTRNALWILKTYHWHWIISFMLSCLYLGLLYGLYVPDWEFNPSSSHDGSRLSTIGPSLLKVKCNVRGDLGPACNAVGFIDRFVMGINHLHKHPTYKRSKACSINSPYDGPLPVGAPSWCLAPFDPEGLLSSVTSVITCFIGAHYGHTLIHFKGHKRRLQYWISIAVLLLLIGFLLDLSGIPLNKPLYSLSYTCVTAGAAALMFSAFYVLVDVYAWRRVTSVLKWMGMNSLAIYALAACGVLPAAIQGFYWTSPQNNLVKVILKMLGL